MIVYAGTGHDFGMGVEQSAQLPHPFVCQPSVSCSLGDIVELLDHTLVRSVPSVASAHIMKDAVIMGGGISQFFDRSKEVVVVLHIRIIEPLRAELVKVDKRTEGNDFNERPYRIAIPALINYSTAI